MKFLRYKDKTPVNLEQIEAFSLIDSDPKYSDITFYAPNYSYTWKFDNKEEAVKVYEKLLNMFVSNIGETIDFWEKPANATITGGTVV